MNIDRLRPEDCEEYMTRLLARTTCNVYQAYNSFELLLATQEYQRANRGGSIYLDDRPSGTREAGGLV